MAERHGTESDERMLAVPATQDFSAAALEGSVQQVLAENIGRYVCCEFLVGSDTTAIKSGILYHVGGGYIVLYEEVNQNYIVCDAFSLKFATIYPQLAALDTRATPAPSAANEENIASHNMPQAQSTPPQVGQPFGAQQVNARAQAQAAFNYAKRKARR